MQPEQLEGLKNTFRQQKLPQINNYNRQKNKSQVTITTECITTKKHKYIKQINIMMMILLQFGEKLSQFVMNMHKHIAITLLGNPAHHICAISFDWQWNIHLTEKILGDQGQHKCMIRLDIEWYVYVKKSYYCAQRNAYKEIS